MSSIPARNDHRIVFVDEGWRMEISDDLEHTDGLVVNDVIGKQQ